ncbi:hypothetical protein JCM11251_008005 [Rhodosporidiobolus azoricus]
MPLPRALSFFSLASTSTTAKDDPSSEAVSSTPLPASSSTSPSDPSTARNRKKRAQKKKAKARRRTSGQPLDDVGSEEEDDRDADEDTPPLRRTMDEDTLADVPEADEDDSYLFEKNHPPLNRVAGSSVKGEAADSSASGDETLSTPPVEMPSTQEGVREAVAEAARRRRALDKEKKIKPTSSTRLQLPPGAGLIEGVPAIRSTPERRRKLEEAGFVPLTDEDGMLRMGVRVDDNTVVVPVPGADEPIMLRM